MKVIHTADLHLSRIFRNFYFTHEIANIRRAELWKNFENTVNICKEKEINLLLISGDIYEKDYFTISDMKRFIALLSSIKKTRVLIITGNHDYISKESLFYKVDMPENVHIFNKDSIEYLDIDDLKTRVHGISWSSPIFKDNIDYNAIKLKDNYTNIFMAHGSVDKNSEYLYIDTKRLEEMGFDYIALGHIHKPMKVGEKSYYSGCPEPLSFSEMGSRGINYIDFSLNGKVEFLETGIRKYSTVEVVLNSDLNFFEIIDKIKKYLVNSENFFRIILKGSISEDINLETIIESLKEEYFYLEFVNNLSPSFDIENIYKENKDNIKGYFIEEMKKKDISLDKNLNALYYGLKALEIGEK